MYNCILYHLHFELFEFASDTSGNSQYLTIIISVTVVAVVVIALVTVVTVIVRHRNKRQEITYAGTITIKLFENY